MGADMDMEGPLRDVIVCIEFYHWRLDINIGITDEIRWARSNISTNSLSSCLPLVAPPTSLSSAGAKHVPFSSGSGILRPRAC